MPRFSLSSCSYLFFFSAERREKDIHEVCEKVRVSKDDITHFKALMIHSFINQLCMLIRMSDLGKTQLGRQISLKEIKYPPSWLKFQ